MERTAESNVTEHNWHRSLAEAIRDPAVLIERLGLDSTLIDPARVAASGFPLLVPQSYLHRMQPGRIDDPLLRQVLPVDDERRTVPGFSADAVEDARFRIAPGLLQKYPGRALLISTGSCAVHCRYCFRRHYPYGEEPRRLVDWQPAIDVLAADTSLSEVLLSGGDPLMLTDQRLDDLIRRLESVPHLQRLRIHTRLPIVLPDRVTDELLERLAGSRLTVFVVVHANHAAEVVADCANSLHRLVRSGLPVLNQAVLLRGVNDTVDTQCDLSASLINLGVIPYYLHQLDQVAGTAHFEVPVETGQRIIADMRSRLPGYAVPQFVQEVPGQLHKLPIEHLA